ncbi:MAG: bifunctional nuclease family protein [Candidatus Hydrothermales bacterium]
MSELKVVEVEVYSIYQQNLEIEGPTYEETFVVILKEKNRNRFLPIWIGKPEAHAIYAGLKKQVYERPLTHDLIKNIIEAFDIVLEKIVINALKDTTYYARLLFRDKEGNVYSIDARPSDSIAIALRTGSKIYVAEEIMQRGEEVDLKEEI